MALSLSSTLPSVLLFLGPSTSPSLLLPTSVLTLPGSCEFPEARSHLSRGLKTLFFFFLVPKFSLPTLLGGAGEGLDGIFAFPATLKAPSLALKGGHLPCDRLVVCLDCSRSLSPSPPSFLKKACSEVWI